LKFIVGNSDKNSVDRILAGIAILLILFELHLLGQGLGGDPTDMNSKSSFALMSSIHSDVLIRRPNQSYWRDAQVKEKIQEGVSVLTLDDSDASVALDNGPEIKVEANSLVTLKRQTKDSNGSVNLTKGKVTVTLKPNQSIQTNKAVVAGGAVETVFTMKADSGSKVVYEVDQGSMHIGQDSPSAKAATKEEYLVGDVIAVSHDAQSPSTSLVIEKVAPEKISREVASTVVPSATPEAVKEESEEKYLIHTDVPEVVVSEARPVPTPTSTPIPTPAPTATPIPSPPIFKESTVPAPTPSPKPSATPVVSVEENKPVVPEPRSPQGFSVFSLTSDFEATQITATDKVSGGNANLPSSSSYSLGLEYNHQLTEKIQSVFYISRRTLSFDTPSVGSLANTLVNLYSFGVGAKYRLVKDKLEVEFLIGNKQVPFLQGVTLSQNEINQTNVPAITLGGTWNFWHRDNLTLGTNLKFEDLVPITAGGYTTSNNMGYGAKAFISEDFARVSVELGASIKYSNESTNLANQQQLDYGMSVILKIPIGAH
jgi:hypothetical protein